MLPILFEAYLEDAPGALTELTCAFEQRDAENLRCAAHKLKGCGNSIKAEALLALCQQIEYCGVENDWTKAENLLPRIEQEFARVATFIENFCADGN